ncbi:hypothetical protein EYF80_017246 [Liparis tanakae]|uniref:Uncharacterized protein n=1 Tax=Liparis tanakae TaxID=230148 RepID=A0A4Z2I3S6_9TELE|nr:hypothetical protein EYF80_017246 [Liparis tanakae]
MASRIRPHQNRLSLSACNMSSRIDRQRRQQVLLTQELQGEVDQQPVDSLELLSGLLGDSIHNCIPDPIIDGLPIIGTADKELVLRAEKRQMVARDEFLTTASPLGSSSLLARSVRRYWLSSHLPNARKELKETELISAGNLKFEKDFTGMEEKNKTN